MTTVKELIADIQHNYIREAAPEQVRSYLNRAYKKISNSDIATFIYYNKESKIFPIPSINLTDELYYEISPDTLVDEEGNYLNPIDPSVPPSNLTVDGVDVFPRKVRTVFAESPYPGYYNYGFEEFDFRGVPSYYHRLFQGNKYYKIPFDSTERRDSNSYPTIQFSENYGLSKVYILFYYTPTPIYSINSKILLDIDKWYDELIDGTVGYYEDIVNGRSQKKDRFENDHLRRIKSESNERIAKSKPYTMPTREI